MKQNSDEIDRINAENKNEYIKSAKLLRLGIKMNEFILFFARLFVTLPLINPTYLQTRLKPIKKNKRELR